MHGIDYTPPMASAQVKSAILLAGLFADGTTTVREQVADPAAHRGDARPSTASTSRPSTDGEATVITLQPGPVSPATFAVPGDPSQAAFWICAAAAIPGSDVTVENLYLSPERSGFLDVLLAMGADLDIDRAGGTVRARGRELHGTVVTGEQLPDLIDEVPALAVAGALAVVRLARVRGRRGAAHQGERPDRDGRRDDQRPRWRGRAPGPDSL